MASGHLRTSWKIIQSYEAKSLKRRPLLVRLADYLTKFYGTIVFLFLNFLLFGSWILINLDLVPVIPAFDPFPFPLLATLVSLEAIFLTIIVLMSQNRQNLTSTIRDELQLQVALIAEKEITKMLKLARLILLKQGVEVKNDMELEEMIDQIDASYIERQLEKEIAPIKSSPAEKITEPLTKLEEKLHKN